MNSTRDSGNSTLLLRDPSLTSTRDVYMCRHSERAARLAAGGAIACMKAVMDGKVANAFALVRYL